MENEENSVMCFFQVTIPDQAWLFFVHTKKSVLHDELIN